jgi:hypothetical protein
MRHKLMIEKLILHVDKIITFLTATVTGIIAALLTNLFFYARKKWEIRRHDYGNLLIELELSKEDQKRFVKFREKLELVSLIGPRKLTNRIIEIKSYIRTHNFSDLINSELLTKWHKDLFDIMNKEINKKRIF